MKGLDTVLACGPPSLFVQAAALSLAGELLALESAAIKNDRSYTYNYPNLKTREMNSSKIFQKLSKIPSRLGRVILKK